MQPKTNIDVILTEIKPDRHDIPWNKMPMLAARCALEIDQHFQCLNSGNAPKDLPLTKTLALGLSVIKVTAIDRLEKGWLIDTIVSMDNISKNKCVQLTREIVFERTQFWSQELLHIAQRGHKQNIEDVARLRNFCVTLSNNTAHYRSRNQGYRYAA